MGVFEKKEIAYFAFLFSIKSEITFPRDWKGNFYITLKELTYAFV
jgi:hypothetical protein